MCVRCASFLVRLIMRLCRKNARNTRPGPQDTNARANPERQNAVCTHTNIIHLVRAHTQVLDGYYSVYYIDLSFIALKCVPYCRVHSSTSVEIIDSFLSARNQRHSTRERETARAEPVERVFFAHSARITLIRFEPKKGQRRRHTRRSLAHDVTMLRCLRCLAWLIFYKLICVVLPPTTRTISTHIDYEHQDRGVVAQQRKW